MRLDTLAPEIMNRASLSAFLVLAILAAPVAAQDTHMQKAHLHTHMKVDADLRASDALRGRKRKCTL